MTKEQYIKLIQKPIETQKEIVKQFIIEIDGEQFTGELHEIIED
jgi:hypothetical protein